MNRKGEPPLIEALGRWLSEQGIISKGTPLIEAFGLMSSETLRWATDETQSWLGWVKRLAEAKATTPGPTKGKI
jgi:hypothetical protein